jgi:hypothetical protein
VFKWLGSILLAVVLVGCGGKLDIARNVNGNFLTFYSGSAKVITVQDTYAKLWWEPAKESGQVTQFVIVDQSGNVLKTLAGNINTTTLTGLSANTLYNLKIRAISSDGDIYKNSPSVSFTTLTTQVHTITLTVSDTATTENFTKKTFQSVTSTDEELPVTYSLSGNPAFVSIDTSSGVISIAPTTGDNVGSPYNVTVGVDNGLATDSQSFDIYVEPQTGSYFERAITYNPGTSAAPFGFHEHLPTSYTAHVAIGDHCAVIYFGSVATAGDGSTGASGLDNVTGEDAGNLASLIAGGDRFPCLVFAPQTAAGNWTISDTSTFIDFVLENYRVNPKRVVVTGADLGGTTVMEFAKYYADNLGGFSAHYPIMPAAPNDPTHFYNLTKLNFWHIHGQGDTWYNSIITAIDATIDYFGGATTSAQNPAQVLNSSFRVNNSWRDLPSSSYSITTNRGFSTTSDSSLSFAAYSDTTYQNWLMSQFQNNGIEIINFETVPAVLSAGAKSVNIILTLKPNMAPVDSVKIDLSNLGGSSNVSLTNTEGFTYSAIASINASTGHHVTPLKIADSDLGFAYLTPSTFVQKESSSVVRTIQINFNHRSESSAANSWSEIELDTLGELKEKIYSAVLTDTSNRSTSMRLQYQEALSNQEGNDGYQPGSGMAPDAVLKGYLWNNDENNPWEFDLSFLPLHYTYDIEFYSSHASDGNDYETEFTIDGTTKTVDSDDNGSTVISFTDLKPSADGKINIKMNKTAASDFGCINGMKIIIKD